MNLLIRASALPLMLTLILLSGAVSTSGQGFSLASSQDPGHQEFSTVSGVKFSVPKGYTVEKTNDPSISLMRHKKYPLALFVAVPSGEVDANYLKQLSNSLTATMDPSQKKFDWKVLPGPDDDKVSRFQTAGGNTKGFNGKKLYQTDYIVVKADGKVSLIGYITELGEFNNSQKYLYDLKGPGGMSMPGWYAQAHIIASVTGERYEEINKGTFITGTPVKSN
ncbi:MAG: hypothetical protein JO053_05650 [Acidobacteria bacterium]|nr:hypothetical protein [Acidobacteriota bacterium]